MTSSTSLLRSRSISIFLFTLLLAACIQNPVETSAVGSAQSSQEEPYWRFFYHMDQNSDGGISLDEMKEVQLPRLKQRMQRNSSSMSHEDLLAKIEQRFEHMDNNRDGIISKDEFKAVRATQRRRGGEFKPKQQTANSQNRSMKISKDIPYRESTGAHRAFNTLDIYYPTGEQPKLYKPVVFFLHGGGWTTGDKSHLGEQKYIAIPEHLVANGFIVVAPNFRYALDKNAPNVHINDIADDIAQAIYWVTQNIGKYGGSSDRFILWGYSSGAHMASLLATDPSYLSHYNIPLKSIKGVIAMDVPQYNVPEALAMQRSGDIGGWDETKRVRSLEQIFGASKKEQERYSPAHFLSIKNSPSSFLLITAGMMHGKPQTISRDMTRLFQEQCQNIGITAQHHHFDDYDHNELLSRFFDGKVSSVVDQYLKKASIEPDL